MEVSLDAAESAALQEALRSYLGDLRMEITQTDNPAFRRELRADRAALESVVEKLDRAGAAAQHVDEEGRTLVRVLSVWWTPTA